MSLLTRMKVSIVGGSSTLATFYIVLVPQQI